MAAHPHRRAATFEGESLTYAELNAAANRVAQRLRDLGIERDSLVACCCTRSLGLIVALLGIMKAGGAYVPIDPEYPSERVTYMLDDVEPRALVGTADALARLSVETNLPTIALDAKDFELAGQEQVSAGTATDTAYVMYTSGSTGKPKGVVIEHRGVVRLVRNAGFCRYADGETWLHFSPLAFDASTIEIWMALLNGGRLVIAPSRASLDELGQLIRTEQISSVFLTTSLFNLMVDTNLSAFDGVRQLCTGGEVASPVHFRRLRAAYPDLVLINAYGPTENSVVTTCQVYGPSEPVGDVVPIGKPISFTSVHILDEDLQPVAKGETGELCTGGDGVARGYLNNDAAIGERFIRDPFSDDPAARLYRTGDLARWRDDGTVDFLGRADNQVKILGHRLEPGEIEAVLHTHPRISQNCVVVDIDDSGAKRLIAYYAPRDGELGSSEVRTYLSEKLPRYMIPALLVPMERIPLSISGKIDRAALPKPDLGKAPDEEELETAGTLDDKIGLVWRRVLKIGSVNLDDNFFEIGGDSLKLVAAHAMLERILKREIPILDMFEHTTLRRLAAHFDDKRDGAAQQADIASRGRGARQRAAFSSRRNPRRQELS
ncbi:MAG: non-ribosomal peptide synthetase [Hyphomicrobiaceae bacterium]|nr:non-ribosomal peptide synthetase [Hyphomicrobiaceae bacterium]